MLSLKKLNDSIDLINSLKAFAEDFNYTEEDVRKTFLLSIANAVRIYYLGLDLPYFINKYKQFTILEKITDQEFLHISNTIWVTDAEYNKAFLDNYHSILKLNLLTGSWICFEHCITALYLEVNTKTEIEKAELQSYYNIKRILKTNDIDIDIIGNLDERLKKELINKHISVFVKFIYLLKDFYPEDRNMKEDKIFLEFFGSCRNCMHNNSVSMKDAEFKTKFGIFRLTKNEPIDFMYHDLIINMIHELTTIYIAISSQITTNNEIVDLYTYHTKKPR